MKWLNILIILFFLTLSTQAQKSIDLNSRNGRRILDSLNHSYINLDKNSKHRKDLLNWPLFYDQAFFEFFDKIYNDIKERHLNLNFSYLRANYFVSENGNIDFFIYELIPSKKNKIKEIDHEYLKTFLLKNHQIDITSKKKYWHNEVLIFEPVYLK